MSEKLAAASVRRITAVRLHSVAMSRVYTTHVAATGGHEAGKSGSRYLLLELEADDGTSAWGELSDIEPAWKTPSVAVLVRFLESRLQGRKVVQRQRITEELAAEIPSDWHRELRRMFATTVDAALLDLQGRLLRIPVYELLGGLYRERLPVSWVAFIREGGSLEDEIREKAAAGFTAYKLKVGLDFQDDIEHVQTVRSIAGRDVYLKVDASGAWEEKEAIERIRTLVKHGVDAVETPIQAVSRGTAKNAPELVNENVTRVVESLARVRQAVPVPIIEHVVDFSDDFALALASSRAIDVLNVAVSQAGSVRRAQRLIHIAQAAGLKVLLGSTVELGVGTACALHVGCASRAVEVASDLVGPGLLVDDVVDPPFRYEQGELAIRHAAGFGVTPTPEQLAKYRYDEE